MIPEVAIANPLVPPSANPRFQPKYMPEMTYPTPNPQSIKGPKVRDNCGGAWEGSGGSFGIGTDFDEDNKKINPCPPALTALTGPSPHQCPNSYKEPGPVASSDR